MEQIISFVQAHYQDILMVLGAIYTVMTILAYMFSIIAKLTPNKHDDALVQSYKDVLKSISINFGKFGIDLRSYVPKEDVDKIKPKE